MHCSGSTSSSDLFVPHYLLPEHLIDQPLLDHFDKMITHHQGFMVVDFTGVLMEQLCQRIPRQRAKDVIVLNFSNSKRVLGTNPLVPQKILSPAQQAQSITQLLTGVVEGGLTLSERKLLNYSCQTLLHAGEISGDESYLCNLISMIKLWRFEGFRLWINQYLWDPNLKTWCREFNQIHYASTIASLCHKLKFLFTNSLGLAELYHHHPFDFKQVMDGKMFFLDASLPQGLVSIDSVQSWQKFRIATLTQQFYQALGHDALADSLLFINSATALTSGLDASKHNQWPQFQRVVSKYSDMKYKRRRAFLEAELSYVITAQEESHFTHLFGRDFKLPAETKRMHHLAVNLH